VRRWSATGRIPVGHDMQPPFPSRQLPTIRKHLLSAVWGHEGCACRADFLVGRRSAEVLAAGIGRDTDVVLVRIGTYLVRAKSEGAAMWLGAVLREGVHGRCAASL
jgi:hypothetical protein